MDTGRSSVSVHNRGHRRPDIQGLRAVSVIVVLAYHAGLPVFGGFIGVDVFFVISGYVIAAMLAREWSATGRINFGAFYRKRFFRLTPALACMVVATLVISALLLSPFGPQQIVAQTAAGAMLLAANGVIASTTGGYFDSFAGQNPLLHTWSLSVEEQFYLVFPALVLAGWALSKKFAFKNGSVYLVALAGGASFVLAMYGPEIFGADAWLAGFYSPLTRVWEFAVGALLAFGIRRMQSTSPASAAVFGIVGAAMLVASLWLIDESTPFPGKWTMLPVLGAVLLIAAGSNDSNIVTRLLGVRPMVWIGDRSYSMYLWHWPFIVFATVLWPGSSLAMVLACAVSILPALVSYRWIETRFRDSRGISIKSFTAAVAFTLIVPVTLSAAVAVSAENGYWNSSIVALQTGQAEVGIAGCFTDTPAALMKPTDCEMNSEAAGRPVYLVGDSNALMFTGGLLEASEATGRPVTSYSFSSCPLIGAVATWSETGAIYRTGCSEYQETTFNWLEGAEPGTVFIASADYYLRDPILAIQPHDSIQVTGVEEKLAAYTSGLRTSIDVLKKAGHEVVVVLPIPNFRLQSDAESAAAWHGPQACSNISLLLSSCAGDESSLVEIAARQSTIWAAFVEVASQTSTPYLDLTTAICPDGTCATVRDGVPVYADYNHISTGESKRLAPQFEARLMDSN